jgi:hypothetical protein
MRDLVEVLRGGGMIHKIAADEITALKARVAELEGYLRRYQDGFDEWRRRAEAAEAKIAALSRAGPVARDGER